MSKEIKFEKGKWYLRKDFEKIVKDTGSSEGVLKYIKFSGLSDGHLDYTERINADGEYIKRTSCCVIGDKEEADMLEVSKFLPTNHPDKIVGLPEEYIVECNSNSEYCLNVYSNFYKDGSDPAGWKYIVCSPKISTAQFENKGIYIVTGKQIGRAHV